MSQNAFAFQPQARADLQDVAAFLDERSPGKAVEFFAAVRSTVDLLTNMPFIGAPADLGEARLHSIRYVVVQNFKAYLLFYRPLASKDGIVIHRILHKSRDVVPLLEASLNDDSDES